MKEIRLSLPEVALVAGTRAALGGGLALLLADRLSGRTVLPKHPITGERFGIRIPLFPGLLHQTSSRKPIA